MSPPPSQKTDAPPRVREFAGAGQSGDLDVARRYPRGDRSPCDSLAAIAARLEDI